MRYKNKKIVKLKLEDEVNYDLLNQFGTLKERDNRSITMEMEKSKVRKNMQIILSQFPVIDFNVEDIPLEEGIALLYQNGGNKHE